MAKKGTEGADDGDEEEEEEAGDLGEGEGKGEGEGEGGEGKKEDPPKETPITEEHRHLFPEKFKTYEAVAKSYAEVEKAKSKAEQEKGDLTKKTEEYEELIGEMEDNLDGKEKRGEISAEDKEKMISDFHEKFDKDPEGTITSFVDKINAKRDQADTQRRKNEGFEKEAVAFREEYGEERFEKEIRPQLMGIANKRPHLNTLGEVVAVWERDQRKKAAADASDTSDKETEKKAAFSEDSKSSRKSGKDDVMDQIANAQSVEELEKLSAKVK